MPVFGEIRTRWGILFVKKKPARNDRVRGGRMAGSAPACHPTGTGGELLALRVFGDRHHDVVVSADELRPSSVIVHLPQETELLARDFDGLVPIRYLELALRALGDRHHEVIVSVDGPQSLSGTEDLPRATELLVGDFDDPEQI